MINLLKTIFVGIIFSFYYFPIRFNILPEVNTKMMLAVIGVVCFVFHKIKQRQLSFKQEFLWIYTIAIVFSLISFISVVYNSTTDYTYATYIVSMMVWLAGAYSVISLIRLVHGKASLKLVFHYMGWVCAVQSILAIIIDNTPALQNIVQRIIFMNVEFIKETGRLYGIGAQFDTAGIRFSCALVGIGYLLVHDCVKRSSMMYWLLWIVLVTLGNAVSRTTTVGALVSLVYILYYKFTIDGKITLEKIKTVSRWLLMIFFCVVAVVWCYSNIPGFKSNLEYGFEGFFKFVETGEWSTASTSKLFERMVIWPDNLKTWIIGDGWFDDPLGRGFYMFTDIGYLRFIFYCGMAGLITFILFFVCCVYQLSRNFKSEKLLFFTFFVLGMVVWIKISTDIFLVYALLLLLNADEGDVIDQSVINNHNYDPKNNTLLLVK